MEDILITRRFIKRTVQRYEKEGFRAWGGYVVFELFKLFLLEWPNWVLVALQHVVLQHVAWLYRGAHRLDSHEKLLCVLTSPFCRWSEFTRDCLRILTSFRLKTVTENYVAEGILPMAPLFSASKSTENGCATSVLFMLITAEFLCIRLTDEFVPLLAYKLMRFVWNWSKFKNFIRLSLR